MGRIALGSPGETTRPDCIKAAIAEVVCTFLFVFAGVGSSMAVDTLDASLAVSLAMVALTHAFVVYGMVSAGFNVSGGHLNPAVTLGLAVGGHITIIRSGIYWIAQLLGSTLACLLLKFVTGGVETPIHKLGSGVGYLEGVVMEIVLTFSLLFTVYATAVDPKKGSLGITAPLCIGLVVGANIMAGGPYSGASMNPARSFGPALVSWDWKDHWVYWVGPLIGGALAGVLHENYFSSEATYVPVAQAEF